MPLRSPWETLAWALTVFTMFLSCISASSRLQLDDDIHNTLMELISKYESMNGNSIWHPLLPEDTSDSHEAIRISGVTTDTVQGNYQQWKHTPLETSFVIFGMMPNQITLFDTEMHPKASIVNEGASDFISMVVFTAWNEGESKSEVYCVVGSENSLTAYKYVDDTVSTLGTWPLHYQLQSLSICQSEYNSMVRLTVQPKDDHAPIDIYNFDAYQERNQLWFSQRLTPPSRNCMSVLMTESYCSIIITGDTKIIAYTLDESSGLFVQKNFVSKIQFTCNQQISFTLDSVQLCGAISSTSSPEFEYPFLQFFANPTSQSDLKQLTEIPASEIAYAKLENLRDQPIILSKTETVRMYTYDPMKKSFVHGYTCPNETFGNVTNIAAGDGVSINGDMYYFFPASEESEYSLVSRIHTVMEPYPSPVYEHMKDVYTEFIQLSNEFNDWRQTLHNIYRTIQDSLRTEDDSLIINGDWNIFDFESPKILVDHANISREDINNFRVEFLKIPLHNLDFHIQDSELRTELTKYKDELKKIKEDASRTIPLDSSEVYVIHEPQKFKSEVTVDHMRSHILETISIENETPEDIFSDLVLYPHGENATLTIPCPELVLPETFYAENVNTDSIGGHSTYSFAYTNDNNHFKTSVEFTQKFTAQNDMYVRSLNGKHLPEDILLASNVDGAVFQDVKATNRADVEELFIFDQRVDENFPDLIFRNDIEQEINCPTVFQNMELRGDNEVKTLNGDNFAEFVESLIFRTHEGLVSGTKTAAGPLCKTQNLSILKTLNSLNFPEDYIRTGHHNSTVNGGSKTFHHLDTLAISVDGTVDGTKTDNWIKKYSKEIRNLNTTWDIYGHVHFHNNVHVSRTIGGANVSDIEFRDIFDTNSDKTDYQPNFDCVFLFNVTVEYAEIKKKINGDTLKEFLHRYITCETGRVLQIPGTTTFENGVNFPELTSTEGTINNRNLSELFHRNEDQVMPNHITFKKPATFKEIHAYSKVDGVNLEDIKNKAVYMRKGESLPSHFNFSKFDLLYESFIASPICGDENFGENVAVTDGKEYQDFEYDLHIQDLELKELIAENLQAEIINEFNWESWFNRRISLNTGETFKTPCEFEGLVTFLDGLQVSTINDYPIEYYKFAMFRTDNKIQKFFSSVDFANIVTENLQTEAGINGYNWTEVRSYAIPVKSDDVQTMTGNWYLEYPVFHDLDMAGLVCDSNLTHLYDDGVHKDKKRPVLDSFNTFNGVSNIEYVNANRINGKQEYFKQFLALQGNQDIHSPITWKNGVDITSSSSSNTQVIIGKINGVAPKVLNAFKQNDDGTYVIATDMQFDQPITTEILTVEHQVQGQNIDEYVKDLIPTVAASTHPVSLQNFVFLDQIIFSDGIHCHRYNGIDLVPFAESFLTTHANFTFNYPVKFTGVVTADSFVVQQGDLTVPSGKVHNIDMDELVNNSIPLHSKMPIEISRLEFAQQLSSDDGVNIANVKAVNAILFQDFLTREESHHVGFLHVGVLKLSQTQLNIEGDFGGYNIQEYYDKSILTTPPSEPRVILGHKRFINMVKAENVTTGAHATIQHLVYMNDAVLHSPVEFRDPVQTDNMMLNGDWNKVNLEKLDDYATHRDRVEDIGGKWTFHGGLVLNNESYVHGLIDGMNVSESANYHDNKTQAAHTELGKQYKSFESVCTALQSIYLSLSTSSLKLQSIDVQQVMQVPHPAQKLLTVQPGESTYLLASSGCGVQVFKFSKDAELFEYSGEILAEHSIDNWQQISNGTQESYIIFSALPSSCSHNSSSGLYLGVINAFGELTDLKLLFTDTPLFFSFTINPASSDASFLVVFESEPHKLHLVLINPEDMSFETKATFEAGNSIKAVDLVSNSRTFIQVVILLEDRLAVLLYTKRSGEFQSKSEVFFYGSSKVFKSFSVNKEQYVLVAVETKLSLHSVKPSCNLQLFRATTGELEFVQSIVSHDIKSVDIMYLDHSQVFLASLTQPFGLYIYKFMGLSGLVLIEKNPIPIYHGESLHVFHYQPWHYHTRLPFIVASCKNVLRLYHSNVVGNSETNPESRNQLNRLCNSSAS